MPEQPAEPRAQPEPTPTRSASNKPVILPRKSTIELPPEPRVNRDRAIELLARKRLRIRHLAGGAMLFVIGMLGAAAVLRHVEGGLIVAGSLVMLTAILVGLFVAGAAVREIVYWRRGVRQLSELVPRILAGEEPLAALETIQGGVRPTCESFRAVLIELRTAQLANKRLVGEMRHRVRRRTDMLERKLGILKAQASRDALTGLTNRHGFDATAAQYFDLCVTAGRDLCALMIDLDNFKYLNDTLGHAAGDKMLKSVAQIIRSTIRASDSAYRMGGDEFLVLMPDSTADVGLSLANRLTSLVDQLAKSLDVKHKPRLSIGVASRINEKAKNVDELVKAADRALYVVKNSRTDRVRRVA